MSRTVCRLRVIYQHELLIHVVIPKRNLVTGYIYWLTTYGRDTVSPVTIFGSPLHANYENNWLYQKTQKRVSE